MEELQRCTMTRPFTTRLYKPSTTLHHYHAVAEGLNSFSHVDIFFNETFVCFLITSLSVILLIEDAYRCLFFNDLDRERSFNILKVEPIDRGYSLKLKIVTLNIFITQAILC